MRESAGAWTEAYSAMEYRHGPISIAAPGRVVWMFVGAPDGLVDQVAGTGAVVVTSRLGSAGRSRPGAALGRRPPPRHGSRPPAEPNSLGHPDAVIVTVTLNPALDVTHELAGLRLGAANRIARVHEHTGGKGLNVAQVLYALGEPVPACGLLGGRAGEAIRAELEAAGIAAAFTTIAGESRRTVAIAERPPTWRAHGRLCRLGRALPDRRDRSDPRRRRRAATARPGRPAQPGQAQCRRARPARSGAARRGGAKPAHRRGRIGRRVPGTGRSAGHDSWRR